MRSLVIYWWPGKLDSRWIRGGSQLYFTNFSLDLWIAMVNNIKKKNLVLLISRSFYNHTRFTHSNMHTLTQVLGACTSWWCSVCVGPNTCISVCAFGCVKVLKARRRGWGSKRNLETSKVETWEHLRSIYRL